MSRLYIVRHGNTFAPGESPRRIGRRTDLPLVPSGIAQAEALGRWFAAQDIRFARAYAGPLQRTRQTAALLLAQTGAPPPLEIADWLAEIDHGPDEDQLEETVVARLGHAALESWDRDGTVPPDWIADPAPRIAAWHALFAQPPEGNTLLVTSNGAARFALLALPECAVSSTLKLRTGAWGVIVVEGSDARLANWDIRPSNLSGYSMPIS